MRLEERVVANVRRQRGHQDQARRQRSQPSLWRLRPSPAGVSLNSTIYRWAVKVRIPPRSYGAARLFCGASRLLASTLRRGRDSNPRYSFPYT
jgi:hypothetical protein